MEFKDGMLLHVHSTLTLHIRFGEFLLAISDVDHVKFMTQNKNTAT